MCRKAVPMDEQAAENATFASTWYTRKMPMSWEILMENLTDPSHFPFSHHGINKRELPHCLTAPLPHCLTASLPHCTQSCKHTSARVQHACRRR
jgi:phenylpropionate dioxygenase-like ring-hydroxylating dioxygenase large terminal subunit